MADAQEYLSQRETARRLGATRWTVRKLLEAEILPSAPDGIPWPAALEAYHRRQESEPRLLTQREAAERLGIHPRQLRRLDDRGAPREPGGAYPWPALRDWYLEFKKAEAVSRKTAGTLAGAAGESGTQAASYYAARALKEAALADIRELEVGIERGELVHVDIVEDRLSAALGTARARLLSLAGAVAHQLADREHAPSTISAVLRGEIEAICSEVDAAMTLSMEELAGAAA